MRNRKHYHFLLGICTLLAMAIPAVAMAADPDIDKFETNFDHDHFVPLPSQGTNILNVAKSDVLPHLKFSGGIFASWERNPVFFQQGFESDPNKKEYSFISNQIRVDVGVGFGLFDIVDLNLSLPIIAYQGGNGDVGKQKLGSQSLEKQALGDSDHFGLGGLRFAPKVRILDPHDYHGFGLGLTANVVIPFMASKYNNFMGAGENFEFIDGLSGGGDIIADYHHDSGFVVALNAGFQYQPFRQFYNYVSGNTFNAKLGLEVPLGMDWLKLVGSAYLSTPFDFMNGDSYKKSLANISEIKKSHKDFKTNNTIAEWAAGLQITHESLVFTLGGGTGFPTLKAVGTPAPRVFLGLGYTPLVADRDGDGIPDDVDQCPDQPEDRDGFEDKDGCPDPDNDQDTIFDIDDRCPNEPGPLANQGCPWADRDGDGVLDNVDNCPDQKGPESNNGCPITDRDGDGIPDDKDKCPDEPEDKDGFEDSDGCPDTDNDHDGIPDDRDKCPNDPEDKDGFQDDDGCPDPDNDNDGIPDDKDKCPNKPETYNGYKDDDGCPDKGKSKVVVTESKIEILEKVFFANNKAIIRKRSYGLLNQVASVLKNYQRITQLRIDGYTDSRGKAAYNLKLSQDRADAVRKYLIDHGVSASRLIAKGFGEEDPIDTNDTAAGRERNRRVEFTITEVNGKPVDTNSITVKHKEVETDE